MADVTGFEDYSCFTGYMVEDNTFKDFDYKSIHRSKQFNEACKHFDNSDTMTRKILLACNEADQNGVMIALSNKLYQHIKDKIDDIDFGTIPQSKGDITKIERYDDLTDCINVITSILQQYNQPTTDTIDVVNFALQNMIERTDLFTRAYKLNIEMPIVIYNTIALSIVGAVSYMISACIEFTKSPNMDSFQMAVNKTEIIKSKDSILFSNLAKFNKLCSSGEFDKAMNFVIANAGKNFAGDMIGLGGAAVILGIILLIIPVIRELVFFFYYARASAAEYFNNQSMLLQMNAYNLSHTLNKDAATKKEIIAKQNKIADFFKKLYNKIKVDSPTATKKAKDDIKVIDSTKYKHGEVLDKVPDSANSVLF